MPMSIFKSLNRCKLLYFFYTFFTVFRGIGIRKIFWFFFQNVFFFEKILFFFKIFIFQIFFSQYKNCHFWKKIIIFETKIVIFETKISFSNKNFIFQTKLSFFWQKSLFLRQKVWSKIQKLSNHYIPSWITTFAWWNWCQMKAYAMLIKLYN